MLANGSDGHGGVVAATFFMVVRSYWFARQPAKTNDCQIQKWGLSRARSDTGDIMPQETPLNMRNLLNRNVFFVRLQDWEKSCPRDQGHPERQARVRLR